MKIQILCGPIASGKSTYSKNAAKCGLICLNDDSIVNMIHANDYTLYDESLKVLYKSVENHIISVALAMQRSILIDRGLNTSIQGRNRWIALAHSFDVPIEAVIFSNEGPEVHAKRRFLNDARGYDYFYWEMVANRHNENYVEPTLEEGFDKIYHISFQEIQHGSVFL